MKKIFTILVLLAGVLKAQPPGWTFNQPITITNPNAQSVVDYQIKLTINTQALISQNKLLANGNDLRFGGTCTGTNFLNYWIEGPLNTPTTAVWVKIPFMAANSNTLIYMFYGNASATPASSIPGTFRGPNSATDSVSGGTSGGFTTCQRGFRFQPNQNVLVTSFGKNEPSGTTRYVTLFNYSSQAILSQTQVAGPAATYSYGPISNPLWLQQGTQYVLQIYGLSTDGYYYQTSSQIGQHLTYLDMQYSNGGTQNTFPNSVLANYHYGYGDFLYYICTTLAITPTYTLGGGSLTITGPTTALCSGATVTLVTNASGTFSWSNSSTSNTIVVNPPNGNTSYSVSETSTTGCNNVAVINLTLNSGLPVLNITPLSQTVCPTNTVIVTASGAITYTWTGGVTNGVPFVPAFTQTIICSGGNGCGTSTAAAVVSVTPLPVVAIANPTVICAGGVSTLSAGGASNFTWMPGNYTGASPAVSASAPTIFTVTGVTGVCSGTFAVPLAVNPLPTLVTAGTMSVCEGKSLTISASGANNYTWTPGGQTGPSIVVTPTASTAYVVTGDNSFSCTSTAQQIVLWTAAPQVMLTTNRNQLCPGQSATLSVTGAPGYTWSIPATGSTAVVSPVTNTTYSVTGASTIAPFCDRTSTVSINVFTVNATVSSATAICPGNTVVLTASGANTYTWSNGPNSAFNPVSPASTTVYVLSATTITVGLNCLSTNSVQVTVNPLPIVTAAATRTAVCKNETNTLTATGAQSYAWSTFQTTPSFTVKANTNATTYTYNVTGTDANGCVNTATASFKVNACTGLEAIIAERGLAIFPNPNSGEFSIQSRENLQVLVVNEMGQIIKTMLLEAGTTGKIDLRGFPKGIYFVTAESSSGTIKEKVVIQ